MKTKRRHSSDFKAKICLATFSGKYTIAELCSKYHLHATQINRWKKEFQSNIAKIFEGKKDKELLEKNKLIEELYKQVGQLKVELDWVKKKSEIFV